MLHSRGEQIIRIPLGLMVNDREESFFFRNEKQKTTQTGFILLHTLHNNSKPLIMPTATAVGW